MIHRLSASGLGRARKCLWWARPDAVWTRSESSGAAEFGTAVHAAIAETVTKGVADPLDYAESVDEAAWDKLSATYAQWLTWWPKISGQADWRAEVPYAWDVRTGKARELAVTDARAYAGLSDYEVPGTADLVGERDGVGHVIDWKTGRQPVESPKTNPQTAFLGGAFMAARGLESVRVGIVKVSDDSLYVAESHELDAMSADVTRDEVRVMIDAVPASEPQPGPWCQWCPAKGSCPATAERVAEVVSASSIVRRHPISLEIRDNDHAAGMLTAIDAIEQFTGELKKRLRAFADANGGIVLPDGSVYSRTDVTTERVDLSVDGAGAALIAAGLQDAIKLSSNWTEIRRVGGKDVEKQMRETLRNMGATKTSTSPRYEAKEVKRRGRAA